MRSLPLRILAPALLAAACGGGGDPGPPPPIPRSVSGTVAQGPGFVHDLDLRGAIGSIDNDAPSRAQHLGSWAAAAGWAGDGDPDDWYLVRLGAGEGLALHLADHDPALPGAVDLDLCLHDAVTHLELACSAGIDDVEALDLPAAGDYRVRVTAVQGR